MKFKTFLLAIFILLVSACAPQERTATSPVAGKTVEEPKDELIIKDALNREIKFSRIPKRVLVVGKSLFTIADALYTFPEAATRIIALGDMGQATKTDWFPLLDAKYSDKLLLASDASVEQIAAMKPQVVLMKSYLAESLGKSIEAINIPVVYLDFETPEQYQRDLRIIGYLFQNENRANELITFYQQHIDQVNQIISKDNANNKPKVLLLYYSDKDGQVAFNVPPMNWIQTIMVEQSGGIPIWKGANPGKGWTKVSLEQIASWDADMVFIIAYFNNVNEVVAKLKTNDQWKNIRAVKEGKIYGFVSDFFSWDQPDTRWILGQLWLAQKIHPNLFQDMDIKKEILSFYNTLYNLDNKQVNEHILPLLKGDIEN